MIQPRDLRDLGTLFGRFARPHWRALVLLTLLSAIAGVLTGLQALVLAPAVDAALLSSNPPARSLSEVSLNNLGPTFLHWLGIDTAPRGFGVVLGVVAVFLGVVALASVVNYAALQLTRWIRFGIASDMQSALYKHVLSLPISFFAAQRIGNLANRFSYDAVLVAQSFDPLIKGAVDSGIQIAVFGFILFRTDATLAATVAVLALSHLGINRALQNQIRNRTVDYLEGYGEVSALVQEALLNARVIKSLSAEEFERSRLLEYLRHLRGTMTRFSLYAGSEQPLRDVANAAVLGIALIVSFEALSAGRLTLTGFVLFVLVVRQTIIPFSQLNTCFVHLHAMVGAARRVLEVLEVRSTLEDGPRQAPPFERAIALHGVRFAYEPGLTVLDGIDLELPRGEVMALVGPSGAGKSTLADLVLRLADPTSGRVSYDGTDVRSFRQDSYRRHFGVVPQEPLLFNASIEENIAYGRPLSPQEVERAARVANAEVFIRELPQGYKTTIGDRGVRLSGGQRQRIAIARAVYARPEILIFDEATSSLDSESEQQVQRAIDQVLEGATALIIAHRLSTVMKAQKIVVLDAGRIVAVGTHAELLASCGLYQRLYRAQFRDVVMEPLAAAPSLADSARVS